MKRCILVVIVSLFSYSSFSRSEFPNICKATLMARFQNVPNDMLIYCNNIKNENQYACVHSLAFGYQSMPKSWVLHCANCKTKKCADTIETVPGRYEHLSTTTLAIIIAREMKE